ncbi:MAG: winged helix-turn-helix domain-containing protein [Alphaproteobacteria bacterium]
MARFRLRIDINPDAGDKGAIGPGKIALLEKIGETGSIAAAAKTFGMSYRQAWLLLEAMNTCFRIPVVKARTGGAKGGYAMVTELGEYLIALYRAMEKATEKKFNAHLKVLEATMVPSDMTDALLEAWYQAHPEKRPRKRDLFPGWIDDRGPGLPRLVMPGRKGLPPLPMLSLKEFKEKLETPPPPNWPPLRRRRPKVIDEEE